MTAQPWSDVEDVELASRLGSLEGKRARAGDSMLGTEADEDDDNAETTPPKIARTAVAPGDLQMVAVDSEITAQDVSSLGALRDVRAALAPDFTRITDLILAMQTSLLSVVRRDEVEAIVHEVGAHAGRLDQHDKAITGLRDEVQELRRVVAARPVSSAGSGAASSSGREVADGAARQHVLLCSGYPDFSRAADIIKTTEDLIRAATIDSDFGEVRVICPYARSSKTELHFVSATDAFSALARWRQVKELLPAGPLQQLWLATEKPREIRIRNGKLYSAAKMASQALGFEVEVIAPRRILIAQVNGARPVVVARLPVGGPEVEVEFDFAAIAGLASEAQVLQLRAEWDKAKSWL